MIEQRVPTVLAVVNSASSGPRRLSGWLSKAGIKVVEAPGVAGLPSTLEGVDGLVLLGGGLMPDDFERAPWLHAERELAAQAIRSDLPTLGICLGAQILADVGGGEVRANFGPKERGSTVIHTTPAGREDPVVRTLEVSAPMIENHEDMITRLPESAILLASSDAVTNQAFRLGAHVRGVQFHPEASAADLRNWDDAALRGEGHSIAMLIAAAEMSNAENTRVSEELITAFGAEVLERFAQKAAAR